MRERLGKMENAFGRMASSAKDKVVASYTAVLCSSIWNTPCYAAGDGASADESFNHFPGVIAVGGLAIGQSIESSSAFGEYSERVGRGIKIFGCGVAAGAYIPW